ARRGRRGPARRAERAPRARDGRHRVRARPRARAHHRARARAPRRPPALRALPRRPPRRALALAERMTRSMTSQTTGALAPDHTVRIVMNGVTGRMGYRQHLVRSILAIRDAGGVELDDGTRLQVEPVLVGRNRAKLAEDRKSTRLNSSHVKNSYAVFCSKKKTSRQFV